MAITKRDRRARVAVVKSLEEAEVSILNITISDGTKTTRIKRHFKNDTDKEKYLKGFYNLGKKLNV